MAGRDRDDPPQAGGLELDERWALVTPHREHLLAIARRRCPTMEDAEDCVHEAMVRTVAYRQLDPARVASLLTAITMRVSADAVRRRCTELRGRQRLVVTSHQVAAPDEALVDHDEARWLAGQVARLPERERQVLQHRAAGFTAAETARLLHLSYKAVESAFTRARNRLRLWAAAATLFATARLRRARNRPAVLTAMLIASAGCLIATTHPPATGHAAGPGRDRVNGHSTPAVADGLGPDTPTDGGPGASGSWRFPPGAGAVAARAAGARGGGPGTSNGFGVHTGPVNPPPGLPITLPIQVYHVGVDVNPNDPVVSNTESCIPRISIHGCPRN